MLPCLTYEKKQVLLSSTLLKELPENKFFEVKKKVLFPSKVFRGRELLRNRECFPQKGSASERGYE